MRTIIFTIAMMLATLAAVAQQNPCEYPLVAAGQAGVAVIDSQVVGDIAPRCVECPATGCVGFQISSADTSFHVGVYSTHTATISVQATSNCSDLLWDTCATVAGGSVSPPEMLFFSITLPPNSQFLVCGLSGDTIAIYLKSLSPAIPPYYSQPIANLDSCSAPLSVAPKEPSAGEYIYFDPYTMQVVRELKPSSTYLKREKFQQ